MSFSHLTDLYALSSRGGVRRLAAVCPYEADALEAIAEAHRRGLVDARLVGDEGRIRGKAAELGLDLSGCSFIPASDDYQAAQLAVTAVSSGEADLLMKGMIKTASLLKAVLNKEWGLRSGALLSHLAIVEPDGIGRPIGITDGGMNIAPDLAAKEAIIANAVECFHQLGVACPKVACLAAVEVVNPDMPATGDAAALTAMNRRGQISGCLVDGPLAVDNAIDAAAAKTKGIDSPVAGQADILLVPSIEPGNMVGKTVMFLARKSCAGVILGAKAPVVMTSRFDSMESKLLSISLGAAIARR